MESVGGWVGDLWVWLLKSFVGWSWCCFWASGLVVKVAPAAIGCVGCLFSGRQSRSAHHSV